MFQLNAKQPETNNCIHTWYAEGDGALDEAFKFRLYLLLGGTERFATSGCELTGAALLPSLNGLCLPLDITSAKNYLY